MNFYAQTDARPFLLLVAFPPYMSPHNGATKRYMLAWMSENFASIRFSFKLSEMLHCIRHTDAAEASIIRSLGVLSNPMNPVSGKEEDREKIPS